MPSLNFYTNPQSRGRIVHWMMEEVGEPYTTHWLDYGTSMKAPEYLAINSMGKVPALTHGDAVVTEAAAICAYLADAFPEKSLAPPLGHSDRAAYFRWLFFAAGPLEMAVTARAMKWEVPDGRDVMAGFGSHARTMDALERALSTGPFICAERFTAADVYVGSSIVWGLMFGTMDKRAAFEAYVARLRERPAFQRAERINEERLRAQPLK